MQKRKLVARWLLYLVGMMILAAGLTLNTKTGLGVSAIMSVPFAISELWNLDFGNVTLVVYIVFIVVQMLLHACLRERFPKQKLGMTLLLDVLQLPLSLGFTRVINLVSRWVPMLTGTDLAGYVGRFGLLILAVILTGVGAAMTLNMRIVPNPGDGIIQTLAEATKKKVGFTKNWFDVLNVCLSVVLGLVFSGGLVGIGIGTVVAALGVGRVIALFNRLFGAAIRTAAGLE